MHNALSVERTHHLKGYTCAIYHPETNMAFALNPKGVWIAKMGQVLSPGRDPIGDDEQRGQRLWLLPEEALYLIERGTVDVRWPVSADDPYSPGLPMSLQAAYAMFLGDEHSHGGSLTFEHYSVYSALRRGGYTVLRAPSWTTQAPPGPECFPPSSQRSSSLGLLGILHRARLLFTSSPQSQVLSNDLAGDHFFRSYSAIYRRLALNNAFNPAEQQDLTDSALNPQTPFRIAYNVYKPSNTTFKKSAPGPPDFRMAIINARETTVPTLDELNQLMTRVPYEPPPETPHFYAKLKHGYKNVVLAVVDQGVTSYLRLADAGFANEKLFERTVRGPGFKSSGKQAGRNRGR